MTGSGERAADAALWRRWRLGRRSEPASITAPDPMLVAAYAEGRLDEVEAEPVDAWLAENPSALDDILAAGAAAALADEPVPDRMVLRAIALVAGASETERGTVVPFPAAAIRRRQAVRRVAAWSGLAASLLITSFVGFGIGNTAYDSFAGQSTATESIAHELTDPPSALFDENEEPDT